MDHTTHCAVTYEDALTWTHDRRATEIRGYCEQLRQLYDRTRPEETDAIVYEVRAIRFAQQHIAAQERLDAEG